MDNELSSLVVIFTEFYYWITVVLMFLIHVGFCMYEVGVSRRKNQLHTLMKNTMLIPLITVTFFLFAGWIYFALPTGVSEFCRAATGRRRPDRGRERGALERIDGGPHGRGRLSGRRHGGRTPATGRVSTAPSGPRSCCSPGPRVQLCPAR